MQKLQSDCESPGQRPSCTGWGACPRAGPRRAWRSWALLPWRSHKGEELFVSRGGVTGFCAIGTGSAPPWGCSWAVFGDTDRSPIPPGGLGRDPALRLAHRRPPGKPAHVFVGVASLHAHSPPLAVSPRGPSDVISPLQSFMDSEVAKRRLSYLNGSGRSGMFSVSRAMFGGILISHLSRAIAVYPVYLFLLSLIKT